MVKSSTLIWLLFSLRYAVVLYGAASPLQHGFYNETCPDVEKIVYKVVSDFVTKDRTVAAPLLRLHFHDCFVRGCDGSVLLNSTEKDMAEKDAGPNKSLDGFFVIDAAKEEVERACPGIVSCADITALAARDAVFVIQGAHWHVETGRRDGRISLATEAVANLPSSYADLAGLIAIFNSNGLTKKDLVLLSGAHTIGSSHCPSFDRRLYNYSGDGSVDPTLDPKYADALRSTCKPGDTTTTLDMDPGSAMDFDNNYYKLLMEKKGLFHSDAALLDDPAMKAYVHHYVSSQAEFFKAFGVSMVRMGRSGVLTGSSGEIRKNCALIN